MKSQVPQKSRKEIFGIKKSSRPGKLTACFIYFFMVGRMRFERMTIALKDRSLNNNIN